MSTSTVAQLPDDLKAALDKLLRKPRTTIDEATAYINELIANAGDTAISRSAVGRYKKRIDEEGKRFREAAAIAKAITKEYGEDTENAVGRMLIEMLRTVSFDLIRLVRGDDASLPWQKVKNIQAIAQTLHHVEMAASNSVEREKKLRKMFVEEAIRSLKKTGLDKEALAKSVESVRGVYGLGK